MESSQKYTFILTSDFLTKLKAEFIEAMLTQSKRNNKMFKLSDNIRKFSIVELIGPVNALIVGIISFILSICSGIFLGFSIAFIGEDKDMRLGLTVLICIWGLGFLVLFMSILNYLIRRNGDKYYVYKAIMGIRANAVFKFTKLPVTFNYEFQNGEDGQYTVTTDLPITAKYPKNTNLNTIKGNYSYAIKAAHAYFLFASKNDRLIKRVIYYDNSEQAEMVEQFLLKNNVEVTNV